jgi:hypothetical protein
MSTLHATLLQVPPFLSFQSYLLSVTFILHEGCPFQIIAFPCNQFGEQEPGTNEEIRAFVESYDVKFIMCNKARFLPPVLFSRSRHLSFLCMQQHLTFLPEPLQVLVQGPGQHPVFALACSRLPGLMGSIGIKSVACSLISLPLTSQQVEFH